MSVEILFFIQNLPPFFSMNFSPSDLDIFSRTPSTFAQKCYEPVGEEEYEREREREEDREGDEKMGKWARDGRGKLRQERNICERVNREEGA